MAEKKDTFSSFSNTIKGLDALDEILKNEGTSGLLKFIEAYLASRGISIGEIVEKEGLFGAAVIADPSTVPLDEVKGVLTSLDSGPVKVEKPKIIDDPDAFKIYDREDIPRVMEDRKHVGPRMVPNPPVEPDLDVQGETSPEQSRGKVKALINPATGPVAKVTYADAAVTAPGETFGSDEKVLN